MLAEYRRLLMQIAALVSEGVGEFRPVEPEIGRTLSMRFAISGLRPLAVTQFAQTALHAEVAELVGHGLKN